VVGKNLVTQLSNLVVNTGDVYISVVPFEIDVNVRTTNIGASWLRWDLWDPQNYSNSFQPWTTYCDQGYWNTKAQCLGHGYNWGSLDGLAKPFAVERLRDRPRPDALSTAPSSTTTSFPADRDQSCPAAQVTPLTYNWTTLNNAINAMSPGGATNQTVGLLWGWLSLLQQSVGSAAGLRQQRERLLHADAAEPDRERVLADRHRDREAARREVNLARFHDNEKSPAVRRAFHFAADAAIRPRTPAKTSRRRLRAA
jgi:hypothetical protein